MAGLTQDQRQTEIRRHERAKKDIESRFVCDMEGILSSEMEGLAAGVIAAIMTIIYGIIALLVAPEPVISKVVALILTAGVGILAVGGIVYVFLLSKRDVKGAWDKRQKDEKSEDDRHQQVMNDP